MPGFPRIDKGEGLIRSHDLLQALLADIAAGYEALEEDRSSQYLRRCTVRAIFSFIEAVVECVKVELRSTVRLGYYPQASLTAKEQEILGPLALIGAQAGKFLPLDQNLKRTFKLAAKIWHLDFRLATGGDDFKEFLCAKSARNRLTHPRTFYDIEVSDHDMHCHAIAGMWVRGEFQRLFSARVESLLSAMSDADRQRLLLGTAFTAPAQG
jgi:hypothetical protein